MYLLLYIMIIIIIQVYEIKVYVNDKTCINIYIYFICVNAKHIYKYNKYK